ncbi:7366_t:CDS:2 [Cetraspora pellucida]|uniref:7366_t:CDS:1 n=1 Tax=Cetraspora pellucida TaxID=1433469 RepID=A0ACA9KAZ0_9GLOM|nr:7366_t:CDS:2 [Cetraspora pellucida]
MLIDQEDFDDGNLNSLSPYMIMHSGLHDIKFVNDAMFHLFLANNLTKKNQNVTNNIAHNNCESQVQPSYENDDDLIQKWQETIMLRKQGLTETTYLDQLQKFLLGKDPANCKQQRLQIE